MSHDTMLLLPIILPIVVAALGLPFLRKSPKGAASLALLTVVLALAALLPVLGTDASVSASWVGPISLDFSMTPFRGLLMTVALALELLTGIYLLRGIARVDHPYLFLFALLLAQGSAAAVILTNNLMVLLVFWEIFLVALYAMIHSSGAHAERVAMKALIIGGASDFLMILGLMTYFWLGGTPDASVAISTASGKTALLSFVLVFLGAGAKAGMFPFHTWIPEAAEVMPGPGFAALPGSLEKILGVSFLYVVSNRMFVLDHTARTIMFIFAIATLYAVLAPALVERNLKRVLALTAISPVGFMIAGMATSEAAGIAGALIYMLTHATYKSAMFLAAENLEERVGSTRLADIQGIGRVMPLTMAGFVLAVAAAIALPPTGGFLAKELIFEGALEHGGLVVLALLWVGAIINVAIMCKLVAVLWTGKGGRQKIEQPAVLSVPVFLLGVAALASGLVVWGTSGAFVSHIHAENDHFFDSVLHLSPLSLASLGVWALGLMLYLVARQGVATPAETFTSLEKSTVLGPGLEMAAARRFDAYEIGLAVVHFVTRIVFVYVERLIDVVADGIIGIGRWLSRYFLSAVHNGVYATYLAWVLVGLAIVASLIFVS
jgi:formate hydrogenlyase subunit 3/multisubunit Na+/H+ antiporter MnhD subunit